MALVGFLLSTLISVIGVISAWRGKVRVWVGDEGIKAWKSRQWPPDGHFGRENRVDKLLFTAVPVSFITLVFPPIVILLAAAFRLGGPIVMMPVMIAAMIGGAFLLMCCVDIAKRRMSASTPAECWRDISTRIADPSSNSW
jgi:hypothetical protein